MARHTTFSCVDVCLQGFASCDANVCRLLRKSIQDKLSEFQLARIRTAHMFFSCLGGAQPPDPLQYSLRHPLPVDSYRTAYIINREVKRLPSRVVWGAKAKTCFLTVPKSWQVEDRNFVGKDPPDRVVNQYDQAIVNQVDQE